MKQRTFATPYPVHLGLTLATLRGGARHPTVRNTAERAWRATRSPEGPVTLYLEAAGGKVTATAWGPGCDWALAHSPALVGIADDPAAFRPRHRLLGELHRRLGGLRLGATHRVFEALVHAVIHQKVTIREAGRSERRLNRIYGEPAPGPAGLQLSPSPEQLASLQYEDLHSLGLERRRAQLLIEVGRRARRLEEAAGMTPPDAARRLTALHGIGPWTSALVVGEALGDADAVPVGDYHLPNMVAWALAGEARADDDRMLELLEPYRGQRRRVALLLKLGGVSAPRYGPKLAPRSFERM